MVIVQISDSQAVTSADQARFQLVLDTVVQAGTSGALLPHPADVVLFAGDFVANDSVLDEWTQAADTLASTLTSNGIPFFGVPGNHDQELLGIARYEEFIADSAVWDFESAWFTGHNGHSAAPLWRGLRFIGVNNSNGAWNTVSEDDRSEVEARVNMAAAASENVILVTHHMHDEQGAIPLLAALEVPEVIGYVRGHLESPHAQLGLAGVSNPGIWDLNSNSIHDFGALLYHEVYGDRIETYALSLAFSPTTLPPPEIIDLVHPLTPATTMDPVASFDIAPSSGSAPLDVQFTDTSTGPATAWAWEFGDGSTSTLKNPEHTYTFPGSYHVTLTVTNDSGSSTLGELNAVSVTEPPSIRVFTALEDARIKSTSPNSNYGDDEVLRVRAGAIEYQSLLKFDVSEIGPYIIESVALRIYVTDGSPDGGVVHPVANSWTEQSVTYASAPPVTGQQVGSFGRVTTGTWASADLTGAVSGDGTVSFLLTSGSSNSALFSSIEGAYPPELIVTTGAASAPVADYSANPTDGNVPLQVTFQDMSQYQPTSWLWDFGDGGTSTAQHPVHTYTKEGTYSVSLVASNPGGSDTLVLTGLIDAAPATIPTASFTATPLEGDAPLEVQFLDTSSGNPTAWIWDFGDGTSSSAQHPTHTYVTEGTYSVSLTVSTAAGSDTLFVSELINVGTSIITSVFTPVRDARVKSSNPSTNYGTSDTLRVRAGSPAYQSYLAFDVAALDGDPIVSATLRVFVTDGSNDGGTVYATLGSWSELGITYANAPALVGAPLGQLGSTTGGEWVELNVSSAVVSEGTYSFAIVDGSSNSGLYSSREGLQPPELVVRTATGGPPAQISTQAVQDALVKSSNVNSNYGTADHVRTRAGFPEYTSYIQFQLSGTLGAPVVAATLRLFVVDGSNDAGDVYPVTGAWSESAITYANAPSLGPQPLDAIGAVTAGNWVEIDVTAHVQGDGTFDFGLLGSSTNSALFSSREGQHPPELTVQLQ